MKTNLIILATCLLFSSCGPSKEEIEIEIAKRATEASKYKNGDIVYLKPDNTKAVIVDISIDYDYQSGKADVGYDIFCHGQHSVVGEHMIFGKEPNPEH